MPFPRNFTKNDRFMYLVVRCSGESFAVVVCMLSPQSASFVCCRTSGLVHDAVHSRSLAFRQANQACRRPCPAPAGPIAPWRVASRAGARSLVAVQRPRHVMASSSSDTLFARGPAAPKRKVPAPATGTRRSQAERRSHDERVTRVMDGHFQDFPKAVQENHLVEGVSLRMRVAEILYPDESGGVHHVSSQQISALRLEYATGDIAGAKSFRRCKQ